MAILGLQGIRGGVGATSITAALAWSLQLLGESVLVIDACPDNMLRLSFNDDIDRHSGWARAVIDGQDWRDTALRYTAQIDVLPFGKLQASEQQNIGALGNTLAAIVDIAQTLQRQGRYQWILIDLPHGFYPWTPSGGYLPPLVNDCSTRCQLPYPLTPTAAARGFKPAD